MNETPEQKTEAAAPTSLLGALLAAQAKIETVRKNGENPHFRSKYATLDEIWESVHRTLNDAGLVVYCTIDPADKGERLVTHLVHAKTGEELTCGFPLSAAQGTPQAIGSAMTYARRYTLTALLEIVTGDGADDDGADDDGKMATTQGNPATKKQIADALGF